MASKGLLLLYLQCYFISIATILGTGILGLPITLYKTGFWPFLLTFTLGYVMQVFVIYLIVEILQYCKALLSGQGSVPFSPLRDASQEILLVNSKKRKERDHVLFDIRNRPDEGESSNGFMVESGEDSGVDSEDDLSDNLLPPTATTMEPNLHIIGKLFLHRYVQPFFLFILFTHFMSIIISYSLAGPEAYGQVLGIKYIKIIPAFTWTLSVIVIVARQPVRPLIAIMTLAKGSLLFATVLVTIYTGAAVNHRISNDWKAIDKPFLMGTVALGGVPMVMPMLFDKFEAVRDQMKGFRSALIGGITTCFILNVMWCWAVLKVVPQSYEICKTWNNHVSSLQFHNSTTNHLATTASPTTSQIHFCDPESTLEAANAAGEISTVPLTKIIKSDHQELEWIAFVIQIFIVVSITVSYLTIGSAMQHTVAGWVDDALSGNKNCKLTGTCCRFLPKNWFWHYFFGLLCFSVTFTVAMFDPKGFVSILEKLASFGLNSMSGIFVFLFIRAVRSREFRHIRICLPTDPCMKGVHYVTLIFFSCAVVYDVVVTIISFTRHDDGH